MGVSTTGASNYTTTTDSILSVRANERRDMMTGVNGFQLEGAKLVYKYVDAIYSTVYIIDVLTGRGIGSRG